MTKFDTQLDKAIKALEKEINIKPLNLILEDIDIKTVDFNQPLFKADETGFSVRNCTSKCNQTRPVVCDWWQAPLWATHALISANSLYLRFAKLDENSGDFISLYEAGWLVNGISDSAWRVYEVRPKDWDLLYKKAVNFKSFC